MALGEEREAALTEVEANIINTHTKREITPGPQAPESQLHRDRKGFPSNEIDMTFLYYTHSGNFSNTLWALKFHQ